VQTQQPEVPAVVVAHSYVGRERQAADHRRSASRRTSGTPGQSAAPPRVRNWLRTGGGDALYCGVENIITTKQQADPSSMSGRPADRAIAYPWLYIGLFAGAGAGVVPLSR
jgi:hypothetical protein